MVFLIAIQAHIMLNLPICKRFNLNKSSDTDSDKRFIKICQATVFSTVSNWLQKQLFDMHNTMITIG